MAVKVQKCQYKYERKENPAEIVFPMCSAAVLGEQGDRRDGCDRWLTSNRLDTLGYSWHRTQLARLQGNIARNIYPCELLKCWSHIPTSLFYACHIPAYFRALEWETWSSDCKLIYIWSLHVMKIREELCSM